ncbi:MAG: restriction endonuclease subunit S [Bacteroidota bacterium]|nr:restriction endonuclease subunit S [Bacteroidota bacterium]
MTNWKKYKLEDISSKITKGTTPSSIGKNFTTYGINYIKAEAVTLDGKIDKNKFTYIDKATNDQLQRSQLSEGDILFSMAGVYLGKTALVRKQHLPANTNQALALIRLKTDIANPDFVHYFFRQRGVFEYVNSITAQSAQPNINLAEIGDLEVFLPGLSIQDRIVSILSSLDDKIELNRRMNQTLEQMAQALFNHYFVDNIDPDNLPEGWSLGKLNDITIKITKGTTPTTLKKQFVSSGINFLKVETLTNFGTFDLKKLNFIDEETDALLSRSRIQKDDILFSIAGTLGRIAMVNENVLPANTNQALAIIRPDKNIIDALYIYYILKLPTIREDIFSQVVQGVQANLSLTVLSNTPVVIPKYADMKKAFLVISPLQKKIESNEAEIRNLLTIRDTLLPKLMSGEIDVSELNEEKLKEDFVTENVLNA